MLNRRPTRLTLVSTYFLTPYPCFSVRLYTAFSFPWLLFFTLFLSPFSALPPTDLNLWSQSGSNRRPPACKAGALPAELWPRCSANLSALVGGGPGWT
jgi:hypothetical protein